MMRSLYSGISGLRNHQTRMDVIGNNIANVNTAGYKTSRVIFQDIFSQNVAGGMGNQGNIGGTNPIQVGLGIRLSSVDVLHTYSSFQRTDKETDLMINGEGFFVVAKAAFWEDNRDELGIVTRTNFDDDGVFFTRAGNFTLDPDGFLVNSQGYYVMGYTWEWMDEIDVNGNIIPLDKEDRSRSDEAAATNEAKMDALGRIRLEVPNPPGDSIPLLNMSIGPNGDVSVMVGGELVIVATIATAMFSNPGGLDKAGNSLYRLSDSSGAAVYTEPQNSDTGSGKIDAGGLEMSNVDLANEFTDMIVTQRGFQANSRIITVSDTMLEELVNLKR